MACVHQSEARRLHGTGRKVKPQMNADERRWLRFDPICLAKSIHATVFIIICAHLHSSAFSKPRFHQRKHAGHIPYLSPRAESKVFWFFSSEKNTLAFSPASP
jgi:hypothetical protein